MKKNQAMPVRAATTADQTNLAILWQQLMAESAAAEPRFALAEDAAARWANDFPHWVKDPLRCLLVAEEEGVLLGFVFAQPWQPPPIYEAAPEVYLNELYVVPRARKTGMGAALVEAVRQWAEAKGAHRLRLGVLAANANGQAFWQQQGAQPLSVTLTIDLATPAATPAPAPRPLGF